MATSLDKKTQVQVKYGQGTIGTMHALENMGAVLHHQVDATKLHECKAIANVGVPKISRRGLVLPRESMPCMLHETGQQIKQMNVGTLTATLSCFPPISLT